MPSVEVLYIAECPSYAALLPRITTLMAEAGLPPASLVTRRVTTDDEAHATRFLGSPTVRVDGHDVDPGAEEREDFGIKCRIYRSAAGQTPAPSDAMLRAALQPGP